MIKGSHILCFISAAASLLSNQIYGYTSTPAAYGVGREGFKQYRSQLPKNFDVVSEGGWYSLQQKYVNEVGKANFAKLKPYLPKDFDVVSAGGYHRVMQLACDPKSELVTLIVNNLRASGGESAYNDEGTIDALVALLQSKGVGFSSTVVDGEWTPVLERQAKKSSKIQKILSKKQKSLKAFSNFTAKGLEFENISYTRRGNGVLKALVKYLPVAEGFDKGPDGKIVLRRVMCDIVDASFKYWKFPKVTLPLKRKGGYLDFLYLDNDIRVTRGNRGGLFVHFRPEYLQKQMGGKK
jgi:hypothetical protein